MREQRDKKLIITTVDVLKWLIEQRESEDPIGLFDGGFYQESDQEGEYEIKPFRILELFKEEKGL